MRLSPAMHYGLITLALVNMVPVVSPGVEGEEAWALLAIAVAAAILSAVFYPPNGQRRLPRWVIHLCVLATVAFLLYEVFAPHPQQTVYLLDLAHFMMLLCGCKFLELRTNRDSGLVALISFLLLVVSAFVSASFLFAVVVIINVTFGLGWLMAFQAKRETDRVLTRPHAVVPAAGGRDTLPDPERSGSPRRGSLRTTAGCALTVIAVATLIFVAIPRGWGSEIFGGLQRIMPYSTTGLSDEVRLEDASIFQTTAPVMRVQFFQDDELITGGGFKPYMRGQTFDRYQGRRWQRAPTVSRGAFGSGTLEAPQPLTNALRFFPVERLIEQRVFLQGSGDATLFSLYPPMTFGSTAIEAVLQDRQDLALQALEPLVDAVRYTVHAAPATGLPPGAVRRAIRRFRVAVDEVHPGRVRCIDMERQPWLVIVELFGG